MTETETATRERVASLRDEGRSEREIANFLAGFRLGLVTGARLVHLEVRPNVWLAVRDVLAVQKELDPAGLTWEAK